MWDNREKNPANIKPQVYKHKEPKQESYQNGNQIRAQRRAVKAGMLMGKISKKYFSLNICL